MKLEDQVCSLELAKTLQDLGVKQESYFHWYVSHRSDYPFILESKEVNYTVDSQDTYSVYSAFTVAELLCMIPMVNGSPFQLLKGYRITDVNPTYCGRYDMLALDYSCIEIWPDENAANACAKVLIYLIQNNLIKLNGSNNESR